MVVKAYKLVSVGFLSVLGFITPDSWVQGSLTPTPQETNIPQEGCTIQEVQTTYPDSTLVETTTWWGDCS